MNAKCDVGAALALFPLPNPTILPYALVPFSTAKVHISYCDGSKTRGMTPIAVSHEGSHLNSQVNSVEYTHWQIDLLQVTS